MTEQRAEVTLIAKATTGSRQDLNHAANHSPRSGSPKWASPRLWCGIVLGFVLVAIWLAMPG